MIESREISMPSKKMLKVLFMQNGIGWTTGALSGVLVCIILGFCFDLRFFVLALIWIFLFVPLVMAFLYFVYGMKPLTAFNSIPHKILFSEDEIIVRLIERKDDEDGEPEVIKEFKEGTKSFVKIENGPDYILLVSNKDGWLYLPFSGFDSIAELKKAIEIFHK